VTATELEDVLALMQRVLPDPSGFAERLVQQAFVWWAESKGSDGSVGDSVPGDLTGLDDRTIIIEPGDDHTEHQTQDDRAPQETRAETSVLLAGALGACDCWGLDATCRWCHGEGSSGWEEPDVDLFQLFVGPAVERLSATFEQGDQSATEATPTPGRRARRPQTSGERA
jgi:hypothetical protein